MSTDNILWFWFLFIFLSHCLLSFSPSLFLFFTLFPLPSSPHIWTKCAHTLRNICSWCSKNHLSSKGNVPSGLSQVCMGWWGESNLNGVLSSRGATQHTHTHCKSYHHNPIAAYGPFQRTPLLQRGWKCRKWVEPPLRWGVTAFLHNFLSLSLWRLVIERRKLEKLPRVKTKSQNSFIFLVIYEQEKSQLGTDERARRWFYVFPCLQKTQNKRVCVCELALIQWQ